MYISFLRNSNVFLSNDIYMVYKIGVNVKYNINIFVKYYLKKKLQSLRTMDLSK